MAGVSRVPMKLLVRTNAAIAWFGLVMINHCTDLEWDPREIIKLRRKSRSCLNLNDRTALVVHTFRTNNFLMNRAPQDVISRPSSILNQFVTATDTYSMANAHVHVTREEALHIHGADERILRMARCTEDKMKGEKFAERHDSFEIKLICSPIVNKGRGIDSTQVHATRKMRKSCDFCCQRKRKCDGDGLGSCRYVDSGSSSSSLLRNHVSVRHRGQLRSCTALQR